MRSTKRPHVILAVAFAVVLALLSVPTAAASERAATPAAFDGEAAAAGGYIRTWNTGRRCLNAQGGGSANGTNVILYDCSVVWNNLWTVFRPAGAAYVYIYLTTPDGRQRCLNARGGGTANYTDIILYDCVAAWNNVWYLDEGTVDDGVVYIKTANPGNRCVNARGGGTTNGTDIILYDCVAKANNMWF